MQLEKAGAGKGEIIIVKKVRPWVKISLAISAVGLSYGLAR